MEVQNCWRPNIAYLTVYGRNSLFHCDAKRENRCQMYKYCSRYFYDAVFLYIGKVKYFVSTGVDEVKFQMSETEETWLVCSFLVKGKVAEFRR